MTYSSSKKPAFTIHLGVFPITSRRTKAHSIPTTAAGFRRPRSRSAGRAAGPIRLPGDTRRARPPPNTVGRDRPARHTSCGKMRLAPFSPSHFTMYPVVATHIARSLFVRTISESSGMHRVILSGVFIWRFCSGRCR